MLVRRTGLRGADKLIVDAGGASLIGRDAVSAIVESTWSQNARLTALGTNMPNAY